MCHQWLADTVRLLHCSVLYCTVFGERLGYHFYVSPWKCRNDNHALSHRTKLLVSGGKRISTIRRAIWTQCRTVTDGRTDRHCDSIYRAMHNIDRKNCFWWKGDMVPIPPPPTQCAVERLLQEIGYNGYVTDCWLINQSINQSIKRRLPNHIADSLSVSSMGEGGRRLVLADGGWWEFIGGGAIDLVQLSISLMVSGRGRFSVSGSSKASIPVTTASAANTTPGIQSANLPCDTIHHFTQPASGTANQLNSTQLKVVFKRSPRDKKRCFTVHG